MSGNSLSELPKCWSGLVSLRELDLVGNRIALMSAHIVLLPKLQELTLDRNPLQQPPLDVAVQGLVAIRSHLQNKKLDPLGAP